MATQDKGYYPGAPPQYGQQQPVSYGQPQYPQPAYGQAASYGAPPQQPVYGQPYAAAPQPYYSSQPAPQMQQQPQTIIVQQTAAPQHHNNNDDLCLGW
ncbi:hypothetical protein BGZ83_002938 [Gryganskiella cystojenkinii]|nr:hypothetical protein BGZ83_002938 [Gryganskiella cystojenkinii]